MWSIFEKLRFNIYTEVSTMYDVFITCRMLYNVSTSEYEYNSYIHLAGRRETFIDIELDLIKENRIY